MVTAKVAACSPQSQPCLTPRRKEPNKMHCAITFNSFISGQWVDLQGYRLLSQESPSEITAAQARETLSDGWMDSEEVSASRAEIRAAKAILKARGWTYRTAGPALGVSHPHLSQVLNGHRQSRRLIAAIEVIQPFLKGAK